MSSPIHITGDGSHTITSDQFKESYHSKAGAIAETRHVFIDAGLKQLNERDNISIFDLGLGTGLNALMTFLHTKGKPVTINYFCIEPYPITPEAAKEFNFVKELKDESLQEIYEKLHNCPFNEEIKLSDTFTFLKTKDKLEDIKFNRCFNLIYFDAFAPDTQPELWTASIFKKMHQATHPEGILVTYSAKGQVRRNMQAAGYTVERLAGCPPKREMLRALKAG